MQFQGFASVMFCYVNHQLVFPIGNTLARPQKNRFYKIFIRVHVVEAIVYSILGFFAYFLLVEHDDQYQIQPMVITSIKTLPVNIGKILMVIALFIAVPLNLFPARECIYTAFSIERNNRNHIILSFGLAASSCLVAISFQHVNSYFGLLGGTAGVLMAGGLPALCYARVSDKARRRDFFFLLLSLIIVIIGFIGAILSLVDPA